MKIYIEVNSCNRRNAEIVKLREYFELNGYTLVEHPENADQIFVSTCAFKKEEEEYSMSRVRALKDYEGKLLVYGCLPDIAPSRFKELSLINHLSPKDINRIDSFFENIAIRFSDVQDPNIIPKFQHSISVPRKLKNVVKQFQFSREYFFSKVNSVCDKIAISIKRDRNFYLFTSRGCLGDCSYCAIRYAIGSIKSKPIEILINEFKDGVEAGYQNFVVLGDDVGAYGLDNDNSCPGLLSSLIEEANKLSMADFPKLKKGQQINFHIHEIHPRWLTYYENQLLDIIRSKRVKSIHSPLESGNNRILKLMKRHHNVEEILGVFSGIRQANTEITLSTQIIVGFPSETEEEFNDTLHLLKTIRFDSVTVFPYHDKENAPASKFEPKIPDQIIQQRIRKARRYLRKERIKTYLSCPQLIF